MHHCIDCGEGSITNVVRMGRKFHKSAKLDRWFSFDPLVFKMVIQAFMLRDDALFIESRKGMAMAISYPLWFNPKITLAQEVFWWVEPDARGSGLAEKLRDGLESWARDRGAKTFEMSCMEALKPEALSRFYRMNGFEPKERNFIKVL